MEKMEFKTKSQLAQEHFHEYLENKLKTDGYSKIESDLYFKFEEYINSRLAAIETTMSMVANGIALQRIQGLLYYEKFLMMKLLLFYLMV